MQTQEQNQIYDDFLCGNDLPEHVLDPVGFRRVQHFNESPYHRGTVIELGGYGIRDEDETAPDIGPRQSIKHLGGRSSIMRVAREIEFALIGLSQRYFVAEYDDPADESRRVSIVVPRFMTPEEIPGKRGKCRSGVSLFVALKADPKRKLYELSFRGFNVEDAVTVVNRIRKLANSAAAHIMAESGKRVVPHTFLVWARVGIGESRLVGKKEQSPVTPPRLAMPDDINVATVMVSGDDFRKFVDLRKELDEYLATGRYSGLHGQALALPVSEPAPALRSGEIAPAQPISEPAPASDEQVIPGS